MTAQVGEVVRQSDTPPCYHLSAPPLMCVPLWGVFQLKVLAGSGGSTPMEVSRDDDDDTDVTLEKLHVEAREVRPSHLSPATYDIQDTPKPHFHSTNHKDSNCIKTAAYCHSEL